MRFALLSALKNLRRYRRDPVTLVLCLGIPVFIATLMMTLFGRDGDTRPRGRLLIADQDDTFLSMALGNVYTQGELGEMITVEKVPLDEGRERIGKGDGSALLVIPQGFADAFFRNRPAKLELVTNPSQSILPGMLEEITGILVEGGYYLHKVIGEEFTQFLDLEGSPPDAMIAETAVRMNRLGSDLTKYLDPPVIELSSEVVDTSQESLNMGELFLPSVMFMTVLFLAFGFGEDIWKEKNNGTLRRVIVTPGSVPAFLAGSVLALAAIFALVACMGVGAGILLMGVEVVNPPLAVVWVTGCGVAAYLLVLLMTTHAASQRAGSTITNLTMMLLMMIGGSFFPFEMMPDFLRRIGERTPNGWALTQLRGILSGDLGFTAGAMGFLGIVICSSAAFFLVQRRLKGGFLL